jgi:hypothetical protein
MADLIATPGAPDANTFADEDAMEAYCEARLGGDVWTGAEPQLAALVDATRDLSALEWPGRRASATQALAWPRAAVANPDDPTGDLFPDDTIPRRVVEATCELAFQYLRLGADPAGYDPTGVVIRKKIDVLETEYLPASHRPRGLARFPRVMALLAPLLAGAGRGGLTLRRT